MVLLSNMKAISAGVKVATARIEKQLMQYLYNMNDIFYFMNMETYEQLEIPASNIGDQAKLLKENLEVYITSYEGEILGIDLPDKVELVVTHTEPAVKGNTTTNALKDAECETGLMVRVPLFIEEGETIIVSTADGKYLDGYMVQAESVQLLSGRPGNDDHTETQQNQPTDETIKLDITSDDLPF